MNKLTVKILGVAFGAALLASMVPGLASAGKPGTGGSISVPDGVYKQQTTATVSGATWVQAKCYQDGVLVYGQGVKVDASGHAVLTLGPTQMWTGGAANCTADAGNYTRNNSWRVVASTTFYVAAAPAE